MAYSELVKNFGRIRDYMREFYVYGFKSRDEFTKKSARSYDDERRRIESWLGEYMQFRQTADGKALFMSIDSRIASHNPLYKAWKTKSFTAGDITLHFILMDIFAEDCDRAKSAEIAEDGDCEEYLDAAGGTEKAHESTGRELTLSEITKEIDERLSCFEDPRTFDESTVRKKLKEYVSVGILESEKRGKVVFYRRAEDVEIPQTDVLNFFSEVAPCGVIGSFVLDRSKKHNFNMQGRNTESSECSESKSEEPKSIMGFKHHYITSAMDSEILYGIFSAISEKREIRIENCSIRGNRSFVNKVVPLCVFASVQSGRQYLIAHTPKHRRITSYRIDNIVSVTAGEICERFDELRMQLESMKLHMWGVSTAGRSHRRMEHVDFTVRYGEDEQFIHRRLEREKRCGTVEKLSNNLSRFSADVYDATELIPWIRTFICRITEIHFSDENLEKQFLDDIEKMYAMYGIEGGEEL